jgi:hypothetical protein
MFVYQIILEHHHTDYYTDEQTVQVLSPYQFTDTSLWEARFRARCFLCEYLRNLTIVDSYQVGVTVEKKDQDHVPLGSWFLRTSTQNPFYQWDWAKEAMFLEGKQAYREGDKELILIEQYLQTEKIAEFEKKYETVLPTYRKELGLLHFLVGNFKQAFAYFAIEANPCLRNITHKIASVLAYGKEKEYAYMKKFDKLYPEGVPFLT